MRALSWRLAGLVPILFVVTAVSFLLMHLLPGNPAVAILGPSATPEAVAQLEDELRLDDPIPTQYLHWLGNVVRGDFGQSYSNGVEVSELLTQRLPATLELIVLAQVLALAISVPLGMLAALRSGRRPDRAVTAGSLALLAAPGYVLGVVMVYVFAVRLSWLPASGWVPLSEDVIGNIEHAVLPTVTLALGLVAVYTRVLRAEMIGTLQQDYVLVAKAKGLSTRRILLRHVLRPSTFPLVTVIGLTIGSLVGGAVLIETIFQVPGIGSLASNAIFKHDYLVTQGVVVVVAVAYVVVNVVIDVLYGVLDPRTRDQRLAR